MKGFITKAVSLTAAVFMIAFYAAAEPDTQPDQITAVNSIANKGDSASFSAVLYDNTNGLPTSDANTILQTSDCFLWIGSYSGLIRYDGNSFHRYSSSVGVSSVISLFEDSLKRLWIGTNDSGVVCYSDGTFTPIEHIEGMKSSSIRSITEDSSGNILIATKAGLAYVDENLSLHVIDDPQIDGEDIHSLSRDSDGTIYGCTNLGAFFTVNDLHTSSYYNGEDLGFSGIKCICPDSSKPGWVYIGTKENVIHADMKNGMKDYRKYNTEPLSGINSLCRIGEDLWMTSDNGIGILHSSGRFETIEDLPMNNSIDDITYDYDGNLWFASSRQGVMKIAVSNFTDINRIAGLESMVVNTTCLYNGNLYIGTDEGLHILDASSYKEKKNELTEMLAEERIRCIKEDSVGNLWLCCYKSMGLVRMDKSGNIRIFNSDDGLASNKVRVCEELSDGRIAVSAKGGVFFIKGDKVESGLTSANGINSADVLTICEGDNGEILLGCDGTGIYVIDGSNIRRIDKNTRKDTNEGVKSDVILRIKKDPFSDTYWIISSSSLAYMIHDEIKTIMHFPYSNNFDMIFDPSGSVWILSSNGIYVTTSEQLKSDPEHIPYLFFDINCGLPSASTANSRSCVSDNGDIYIAGTLGVSCINIHSSMNSKPDIHLTIPFVEADGKMIKVGADGTVTIPDDVNRLTVYAYSLTYSPVNPTISYKMHGYDKDAFTTTKRDMQPVSYTNLPGGKYIFELSEVNTLTGHIDRSISITIDKKLSLFEQLWFRITVIAAGFAILITVIEIVHRKREAKLIREQENKQLLIDEMTHAFARCVDMKDDYTNGHSERVAEYSKLLAQKMGKSEQEVKNVYNVALLHDIGKISIPDSVLHKPGKPTDEEYAILKTHTSNGFNVLKDITIAPELAYGAGYHHERLDGKGYPNGLKGDEIPEVAQIIAVADTFDAMYSTRPYRKQMDVHDVLEELKRVSGTQLNGEIVDHLVELVEEGKIGQRKL